MFTRTTSRLLFALLPFSFWILTTVATGFAAPNGAEGKIYLPIVASGNSGTQTATPTVTPITPTPATPTATPTKPFKPSDQALIAAALEQGKIDYGTSLLYRFYSLFADDRLPTQFRGDGSIGEDQALFAEAADPALSAEVKAKLRPFLLRPDDPESVHSVKARTVSQVAAAPVSTVPCDGVWAAQSSTKPGVKARVHALCFNDYTEDIQAALALIESLWTPMTNMMGQPLPDLGGPASGSTDEIDFYLLDPLGVVWREGENQDIRPGAVAVAPSAEPFVGDRSSGFVLVARSDLGKPELKSTVAHEFFHVLQKAHNRAIAFHGDVEWWFVEASAKWAEWYFVPETSDVEVHPLFSNTFRNADQPLHRSYDISDEEKLKVAYSAYAGYIWPFFVQQEKGNSSMGEIWKDLDTVGTDWDKGLHVIDEDYAFALHFHRFGFRNLNSKFGDDNPLGTRYVDLDAKFPDDWLPAADIEEELAPMPPKTAQLFTDTIPSLRTHYYHFTPKDQVRQVTFDLTGLQPLVNRKVGAVIKIKGRPWEMRELVGDVLTFCRSNPEQDLEEIWFVASHDRIDLSKTVTGPVKVQASNQDCACDIDTWAELQTINGWKGHITYHYEQRAARGDRAAQIVEDGNLYSTLLRTPEQPFWGKDVTGSTQVQYQESCCKNYVQTISGSGAPVPFGDGANNDSGYSRMLLSFRESDCTYNFHANTFVNGVFTSGDSSSPGIFDTGAVGGRDHPVPRDKLILSGSASFPVHTQEFIYTFEGDFFSAIHDLELVALLGEGNLGYATVTWRFEPIAATPEMEGNSPE